MNKRLIMKLMGRLLLMEAVLMLPSLLVSLIYGQGDSMAFVYAMLITAAILDRCGKPAELRLQWGQYLLQQIQPLLHVQADNLW
ncbi:MAG: hypothetical protein IJ968_04350 [Clostridia bacterium]|nr:hypothetical protein [Clostridia bacterium]